jgi:hypothetical protein
VAAAATAAVEAAGGSRRQPTDAAAAATATRLEVAVGPHMMLQMGMLLPARVVFALMAAARAAAAAG